MAERKAGLAVQLHGTQSQIKKIPGEGQIIFGQPALELMISACDYFYIPCHLIQSFPGDFDHSRIEITRDYFTLF